MAKTGGPSQQRAERERARLYQARRAFHESRISRRRRDNLLAGLVGGVLILAVAGAQLAYYTVGPGTPVPAATTPAPADVTPTPTPATPAP
ncbi:dioxygenase [Microbacterium sp. NPDC089189]|uniref:dioxygenase n=1 Tax=Microbacterium sp. NPDC089189 TaxID=3154972 RepID=UPI003418D53F